MKVITCNYILMIHSPVCIWVFNIWNLCNCPVHTMLNTIKISGQYEGNTRYIVSTNSIEGSIFLYANFMPFGLSPFLSTWAVLCGNDGDYLLIHFCRFIVLVCRVFLFACIRPRYWLHRLEQRQRVSLCSVSIYVLLEIWQKLKVNEWILIALKFNGEIDGLFPWKILVT